MKQFICTNCGSHEFYSKNGFRSCQYCGSIFALTEDDSVKRESIIALDEDIQKLLDKCKQEPWKAKTYANLVLDIDPRNKEALQYLGGNRR